MKDSRHETSFNDCLLQYFSKFDDSELDGLIEKIEELVYPRASFFQDLANTDSLGKELQDKMEDFWRDFDDIPSELHELFRVLTKLRREVSGLAKCESCGKMGVLKPKLLQSVLGTGKIYISNLCEYCYSSKTLVVNSKTELREGMDIPEGLKAEELLMIDRILKSGKQKVKNE